MKRAFLDDLMEESTAMDPDYPRLVEQAIERRAAARALAEPRSPWREAVHRNDTWAHASHSPHL